MQILHEALWHFYSKQVKVGDELFPCQLCSQHTIYLFIPTDFDTLIEHQDRNRLQMNSVDCVYQ